MRRFLPLVLSVACNGTLSANLPDKAGVDGPADADTDADADADTAGSGETGDADTDADADADADADTDADHTATLRHTAVLPPEDCGNGLDDDLDSDTDCDDADCAADPVCLSCPDRVYGAAPIQGNTSNVPDDDRLSCGVAGGRDQSIEFTAPAAGRYTFSTAGSQFDTVVAVLDACGGTELDCNDDFVADTSAVAVTLAANQTVIAVVDGRGAAQSGPYVLSIAPTATVETYCSDGVDGDFDGLADCADPDCAAACNENCTNGLDDDQDGATDCADADCAASCVESCANGADDDQDGATDCADADCAGDPVCVTCPDLTFTTSPFAGTTAGRRDDLTPCAGSGALDAQVSFTAPSAGTWTFSTDGSAFDTVLSVLDGCGGAVLACDDDSGVGSASLLSVSLAANQTVILSVDGYNSLASGAFVLTAGAPESACANGADDDGDGLADCDDPDCAGDVACACYDDAIAASPYRGDTSVAVDDRDPSLACGGGANGPDDVLEYTIPTTGTWKFTTDGSTFDTVLYVLDGCTGAELGCDDDSGESVRSLLFLPMTAGDTVAVVVDGFSATAFGAYTLTLERAEGSCSDHVDEDGDGALDCRDTDCAAQAECATCRTDGALAVGATITESTIDADDTFDPGCTSIAGGLDHTWSFTAPAAGSYTFDTIGSSFDTVLSVVDACPVAGTELACHDDIQFGVITQSQVTVTLAAGQTVWVVVDGYDSLDFGDYVLHVQ